MAKPHKANRLGASAKPTQPPAGDFATFSKALYDKVRKDGYATGAPFQVFADGTLPKFTRWVSGLGEYDAVGLRDVVNTNALFLDEVKGDLDQHRSADNARHAVMRADITALQAEVEALRGGPFPG